jgi:hypothetical protein
MMQKLETKTKADERMFNVEPLPLLNFRSEAYRLGPSTAAPIADTQ